MTGKCFTSLFTSRVALLLVAMCSAGLDHAAAQNVRQVGPAPSVPAELPTSIEYLQNGVRLTLVAEHPQIVTPTGIDVDEQGRVWAVASHTHFRPDGYQGPEADEVLILSDRDGDGRADRREVFYDKTVATMDLELGADGWVYLAERDRIVRIRDTDGDGRADVEENLAVLETEGEYPHNAHAGLAWHPSGDLVFGLGENHNFTWTLTGADGRQYHGTGEGGVFRCRPDGTKLHRVARGFWNPFGLCVLEGGEMFAAENDPGSRPPCRLLHVVEGGDYGYQRLYGEAPLHPFVCWNGELKGTLPMLEATGEAPCGIAPLGGGVLVTSWADHRLDFYPLRRSGATFETERVEVLRGSDYFRPTCIAQVSPGLYYLTDWVFGSYELHGCGRVWKLEIDLDSAGWIGPRRVEPPNAAAKLADELRQGKSNLLVDELLALARAKDAFRARAALLALSRQATDWNAETVAALSPRDRVSAAIALKLADPSNEQWPAALLEDASPDVRFEALRWITDHQLTTFRPAVEEMLKRADLSYRLFEACLAASNTLAGNPRKGIDDKAVLLERVNDESAPAVVRGYALRLLPADVKGLSAGLLARLARDEHRLLSLEATRTLARREDAESLAVLLELARDELLSIEQRAEAIAGLAAAGGDVAAMLVDLAGDDQPAVREEALRALRLRELSEHDAQRLRSIAEQHPQSADLVRAVLDPDSIAAAQPPLADLPAWLSRLAAVPGEPDLQAGRRIFFHSKIALCANCHRHDGRGNVVGPDLTTIGQRGQDHWVLSSLLQPSREVSPQFFPWTLVMDDGTQFIGILLRKGGRDGREHYRNAEGGEQSFAKQSIVLRQQSQVSIMPEGLVKTLTDRELRDLIAFLEKEVSGEQ